MTLYLNTTDFNSVTYALKSDNKIIKKSYKNDPHKSYETLGFLDKFLRSHKIKNDDVKKIIVNKGPGSFTGTRLGVSHALALGFALSAPVKFVATDKFSLLLA
jgi:tRNA A37 threonylcarbamoyladenosine modification protein TsaB